MSTPSTRTPAIGAPRIGTSPIGTPGNRGGAAARAAALLATLVVLSVPSWMTSAAHADQAAPAPVTDEAVGTFPLTGPLPSACVKTDALHLDGTYTYGQRFAATVTHDRIGMHVRAGTYSLHDCVREVPELGIREQSSWLDPAPDPHDPTSFPCDLTCFV